MNERNFVFNGQSLRLSVRDDADESVVNEIFKFREYRRAEEVIAGAKDPIIDAGAHAGFFCAYARTFNNKVKIYAVEPEENNLLENVLYELRLQYVNKVKGEAK